MKKVSPRVWFITGTSQALAQEVKPLGIDVTIVEPGSFRTNFLKENAVVFSPNIIDDYAETSGALRAWGKTGHGTERGNAKLGAEAIIKAVTSEQPPLHLLLGTDAYQMATQHLDEMRHDFETWRDITCSTDIK